MPQYRIRDPRSNKTVVLTGDSPPTEQELHQIFARLNTDPLPMPAAATAGMLPPSEVGGEPSQQTPPGFIDRALGALPAIGGMAGGIIGGIGGTVGGVGVGGAPGALGGAALGGAAGEAAKQLVSRLSGRVAPETPLAAASAIGREGLTQGALEAAGGALGAGARVVGKALVENAVRPTMSLVREFPDVIETIVRERLPVGRALPMLPKGSERALAKLGDASSSVRALLEKAGQSGRTFDASQLIQKPIFELIDDISKAPLGDAQERQLTGMIDEFLKRHGSAPLTPEATKALKAQAQSLAKPVYKAVEKGFPVTPEQSLTARFNAAVATGTKEGLETIPGVAEGEARKKSLIGASRALKQAENRRLSLAGELGSAALGGTVGAAVTGLLGSNADAGLKSGVTGWLIARGVASPRSLSRGGLVLTSRQAQALLREFPRLAEYMATEAGTREGQGTGP